MFFQVLQFSYHNFHQYFVVIVSEVIKQKWSIIYVPYFIY